MSFQRVAVYRNLHKNCYFIRSMEGRTYGRVIKHMDDVLLYDATFRVQQKGRQRVLETGRKNVHAFVVGYIASGCPAPAQIIHDRMVDSAPEVFYNPYHCDEFLLTGSEKPVKTAEFCLLSTEGVFIDG